MASIDREIADIFEDLFDWGGGAEESQTNLAQAVRAGDDEGWLRNQGLASCGTSDIDRGFVRAARRLPAEQRGPMTEAIQSGAQSVTIGSQTFPMPPPTATPAQRAIELTNIVNQTNTTNVDMSRDVTNNVTNVVSGIGNTVTTDIGPTVSGDGAVGVGGDANAPITTGDGNTLTQAGGDANVNVGDGTQVDDSNLTGVSFGSGDATGAGPGGTAVGGDVTVAGDGATIADDGGVAAGGLGGTVGTAATGGSVIDQSVDASTTAVAGGDMAGGNMAGGDMAGGDLVSGTVDQSTSVDQSIDQSVDASVDVNVAQADAGAVAQAGDAEVDMTDPMA